MVAQPHRIQLLGPWEWSHDARRGQVRLSGGDGQPLSVVFALTIPGVMLACEEPDFSLDSDRPLRLCRKFARPTGLTPLTVVELILELETRPIACALNGVPLPLEVAQYPKANRGWIYVWSLSPGQIELRNQLELSFALPSGMTVETVLSATQAQEHEPSKTNRDSVLYLPCHLLAARLEISEPA